MSRNGQGRTGGRFQPDTLICTSPEAESLRVWVLQAATCGGYRRQPAVAATGE